MESQPQPARPFPGTTQPGEPLAAVDIDALAVAWGQSGDLAERRAIEHAIAEAVRPGLLVRARIDLARIAGPGDRQAPEDVAHQAVVELPTVLAAYLESARQGRFAGERRAGAFGAYLNSATRNIARDLVNGSRRHRRRLEQLAQSYPSRLGRTPTTPSQCEMREETRDLLARELAGLEPLDRRIVVLHSEGMSLADLGRELGMPRETVRDRYAQARARLRRAIERAMGGDPGGS